MKELKLHYFLLNRVDAATQVSAPASPEKLNTSSRRVNNTPESRSVLRQEEENSVGRSHIMLYTSNTSLPLGISARKLEKTAFVPIDEDHHDLDDDENEDVEPVNLQELLVSYCNLNDLGMHVIFILFFY